jgi:hypothetical protein
MVKVQRPPTLKSQTLKVLVKPAGPHHLANRSGSAIAAKTRPTAAGISRDVRKVPGVEEDMDSLGLDGGSILDDGVRHALFAGSAIPAGWIGNRS